MQRRYGSRTHDKSTPITLRLCSESHNMFILPGLHIGPLTKVNHLPALPNTLLPIFTSQTLYIVSTYLSFFTLASPQSKHYWHTMSPDPHTTYLLLAPHISRPFLCHAEHFRPSNGFHFLFYSYGHYPIEANDHTLPNLHWHAIHDAYPLSRPFLC